MEVCGKMPSASRDGYSFLEVCADLNLEPPMLRRLLREFAEEIGWRDDEPEASSRFLTVQSFEIASLIAPLFLQGMEKKLIQQRLVLGRAPQGEKGPEPTVVEMLVARIERLESDLLAAEQKRGEERDKMLTTLARLQQEVQKLNAEIAVSSSRKERKRRSLF